MNLEIALLINHWDCAYPALCTFKVVVGFERIGEASERAQQCFRYCLKG